MKKSITPEMGRCQTLVDKYNKSQVMIIATDAITKEITVSTFGKTKEDKMAVAQSAIVIKRMLGIK
jgi:hypothetical protein